MTIVTGETTTRLQDAGGSPVCESHRPDHRDHVLAWADSNGIRIANDPRFPRYRGTYRLRDGIVSRPD